ncbi:MAG: PAS domain S-box protein [Candidatus Bathyarchaeota archaeon]|nr:PAS domain S-box protein [Candidatus Bathyarchaeota archaeon]
MNLYAILSLFASTISLTIGISVFFLNRTAKLNRLFLIMMIFNSYWAFCLFMMSQSSSLAGALFWQKALFLWPFIMSLLLHFTLVYTESNLLKNKFILVALYFPALFFSLTDLTTPNVISTTPILKFWGYQNTLPNNSLLCWMDNIWACSFAVLSIVLFVRYHNNLTDKIKRQQAKFVAAAFTIPIFFALITDSLFPFAGIDFPGLGAISCSLTTFFVAYGMLKYELFSFRPEIAAENIFSTMSDSVILVMLDGKIMKVNQAFLDLTGYSEEEVVGKSINELLSVAKALNHENSTPRIIENLANVREIRNYELSFHTKTGEKRIGTISCSMVSDNGGKDVGAAFVLRDVTERRAIEQKLLKAERFASIGELAGILGHDLRNPLSGIRNAAYYLKKKHSDHLDDKDLAMFESIDKSIDYSNKIVNDLLDYSCEIKLKLSKVSPKMLVRDSLALLQPPENITIIDDTSEVPVFKVDIANINRAFIKILQNAFDAMSNGGKLRIKSEVKGEKILFRFQDNGSGMTQEMLTKLWTPLCTTKAKGMGFGLPICKRLVEAHGGNVSVESCVGQGTCVRVELPLSLGAN